MIRILGRKLLFDTDEQYLGTTYDAESGTRTFQKDRRSPDAIDLSALSFYVLLNYKDGNVEMMDLEKSVTDTAITLTWSLSETIFKHEGYCAIWIRATDAEKVVRWSSEKAIVYITEAGNGNFSPSSADSAALLEIEKAEKARVQAEADRVTAENARSEAETGRVTAEQGRVTAEASRVEAETARADAETLRAAAEAQRATAETARQTAESQRSDEESKRISNEETRVSQESGRVAAEEERVQNETARRQAETERASAEASRVTAETAREQAFTASEEEFENTKTELKSYAKTSESWAIGGTGTRDGEDTDNSKYYSSLAKASEESAASSAESAKTNMETVQSLTTLVIPEFKMSNNRIYMTEDGTDRFLLESNRIYVKRIEVA